MGSDKHLGPVKEGELPGEFTSMIARVGCGWITAAAAGTGPPAPTASGALAAAALLFLASSTRL